MKCTIDVPEYDSKEGLIIDWELGYRITAKVDIQGTIVIKANSPGLISLARHLLLLAQPPVPQGHHLHLDASNSLEEGSIGLIIERE
jgi:hypothetical protein